jgi:hypothetical protein
MQMGNNYQISISNKPGYDIYFTDETGHGLLQNKDGAILTLSELPKPLLKQIK